MLFNLDPLLAKDSDLIMRLSLCEVRLMKNAAFPWILLIPQQDNCSEILDLNEKDRQQLFQEILLASEVMQQCFKPTKLNIANLGNQVPQLHVHVIARYNTDAAWPNPVWGSGMHEDYEADKKAERIQMIKDTFTHRCEGSDAIF